MKTLKEIILKKIGKMVALPKAENERLLALAIIYEDFPVGGYFYRLGDFILAFPTRTALTELKSCEWGLVTDLETGKPLALLPEISCAVGERLYRLGHKRIFIIANDCVYCGDYPTTSHQAESVWIPLSVIED